MLSMCILCLVGCNQRCFDESILFGGRAEYEPNNDLLDQEFMLKGKWFQRKDIEVRFVSFDANRCLLLWFLIIVRE